MDEAPEGCEAGEAEHGHVRVPDDPIRKMHALVDGHLRLQGTLQADDQIEHGAGRDEAQAGIAGEPAGAP